MVARGRWGLFWLFLGSWNGLASPFAPSSHRFSDRRKYAIWRLSPRSSSTKSAVEEKQKEDTQRTKPLDVTGTDRDEVLRMTFVGTKSVSTASVVLPKSGGLALNEFFSDPKHRNLLFFRNDVSVVTNPSQDLIRRWSEEVAVHGGSDICGRLADSGAKNILRMKAYVKMPGLRVLSETFVGANLILGHDGSFPEYQFTVIDTKLTPEGAAPLVWLFNKLTKYMDKTSSFSRVRPVNADASDSQKVAFTTDARLETKIHLPSAAAKVLPINISKFERQGSRSMQKLLEKELEPALLCFRDAFVRWSSDR